MGKSIDTLVADIHALFESEKWAPSSETINKFGSERAKHLANRASEFKSAPKLRLSNIGTECTRTLWYTINKPNSAEKLSPQTRFKFLIGDLLEELLLFLAEEAGHSVEGRQTPITINGVTQLLMMKADVLSNFENLKVCTHYKYNGKVIDYLPYDISPEHLAPVYKEVKGWNKDLTVNAKGAKVSQNPQKEILLSCCATFASSSRPLRSKVFSFNP